MYDDTKPDLIVHPKYYKSILNYDLEAYFNLLPLHTLTINTSIEPIVINERGYGYIKNVQLEKFFDDYGMESGIKPENTTYTFGSRTPLYNIEENGPRYVIWTTDDPLTICATYVDRVEYYDLYEACRRAKSWAYPIERAKSIIVFDLDETLIDKNGQPLRFAQKVLNAAKTTYDLMVLYSHGSCLHVDQHLLQFKIPPPSCSDSYEPLFDLVLSKAAGDVRSSKNLLYIYNYFPNIRFKSATLVDDSLYNWTPEYNRIIVPNGQSLIHALKFIDGS